MKYHDKMIITGLAISVASWVVANPFLQLGLGFSATALILTGNFLRLQDQIENLNEQVTKLKGEETNEPR